MTKRIGIVAILALAMLAPAAAQDRVDLVVLLDSSQSMFPYYNQVVDYVLSETVREYMRFGDAFHLLAFSDSTQVEIAQVLRTEQDLKSVVARLYLLYPLGRNTDLVTAIKNVYRYVADLPEGSAKHIILITDGMHSPAAGTQYADLDAAGVRAEIDRSASRIRERGWTMRIVRVPFDGSASSIAAQGSAGGTVAGAVDDGSGRSGEALSSSPGSGDYLSDVAAAVGAEVTTFDPANAASTVENSIDLPRVAFPADLGVSDYAFTIPMDVENRSSRPLSLELTRLLLGDGTDILRSKEIAEIQPGKSSRLNLKVMLPESLPEGKASLSLEPRFADGLRVSPARTSVSLTIKRAPMAAFFRNSARVALFLVILAIACAAALIIAVYVRRAHRKAEEPIVDALLDSAAPSQDRDAARSLQEAASRAQHVSPYATVSGTASATGRDRAALLAAAAGADSHHVAATERPESRIADSVAAQGARESRSVALLASWKAPTSRRSLPKASDIGTARASDAAPGRAPVHYESRVARAGSARLILRVADQNQNIGKRNIRAMHAGGRASIGGGSSDFLVFLLPVPRALAWLYYDGVDATLVPSRPEFFPDYDGAITGCIGKEIRMVTARGKELIMRFDRYEAPIDRINKILHCIESPGLLPPVVETTDQTSD
ncbi:MAG: hypothetical protein CVV47_04810 [Spirochaetae bacterium HGW-Spirochaetae-3]|jgi:hypothetical protein|nr:MAG: hypothetical protein CVV47_04810 [Spirochaetae bacterium HGW-Spirochaetae-3]